MKACDRRRPTRATARRSTRTTRPTSRRSGSGPRRRATASTGAPTSSACRTRSGRRPGADAQGLTAAVDGRRAPARPRTGPWQATTSPPIAPHGRAAAAASWLHRRSRAPGSPACSRRRCSGSSSSTSAPLLAAVRHGVLHASTTFTDAVVAHSFTLENFHDVLTEPAYLRVDAAHGRHRGVGHRPRASLHRPADGVLHGEGRHGRLARARWSRWSLTPLWASLPGQGRTPGGRWCSPRPA